MAVLVGDLQLCLADYCTEGVHVDLHIVFLNFVIPYLWR